MTTKEAIGVLDAVTDPRNAHKLTRQDYASAQNALVVLSNLVAETEKAKLPATTQNALPDEPE